MEYELFKTIIKERILEFLPPVYHSYTPEISNVTKVNETKDAFRLMPPGDPSNVAMPTLYLDDLYRDFAEDEDLERVLSLIAQIMMKWSGIRVPELAGFKLSDHKDCVVANIIGTDRNPQLLDHVPHVEFLDMSVIFRLVFSSGEEGINSMIITNQLMEDAGLTREKLFQLALENTPRMYPAKILEGIGDGIQVVTNELGICGATVMVYPGLLDELATKMEGDFYILPSSIHEFFAIPADSARPEDLVRMLADGNEHITPPSERLSNVIYKYDAERTRLFKCAGYIPGNPQEDIVNMAD